MQVPYDPRQSVFDRPGIGGIVTVGMPRTVLMDVRMIQILF
jgi:hypothetical protein